MATESQAQQGAAATGTRNRGFASMSPEKQREIARKGGRAAHEKGKAHEFTSDEARSAGRKGGEKVSVNRNHMAEIGRRGGRSSATRRRSTGGDAPGQNGGQAHGGPERSDTSGEPGTDGGGDRAPAPEPVADETSLGS
jgi:general stress protein YciG